MGSVIELIILSFLFFFLISFFGWMQLIIGGVFIIYIRHYHNVIYIYIYICHVMLPIPIVAADLKGKLVTLLHYMSSAQGGPPLSSRHRSDPH